ncbi:hypothetical protein H5410_022723 [Solanum commersonii]|uniref:Uncharacterized protein n=1 Tax=Solanum commersonii TaxID=4109 RepID=A0A9J5ZFK8_SOLCO|nr:hypothetical protein H5410_022723 [Solanum commersonii]
MKLVQHCMSQKDKSRTYAHHFDYQRLLQFLIGLNDSYASNHNRSQILMMTPTPSINQAYSMLISEEGQRSLGKSVQQAGVNEDVAFYSNNKSHYKHGSNSSSSSSSYRPGYIIANVGSSSTGGSISGSNNSIGSDSSFKPKKRGGTAHYAAGEYESQDSHWNKNSAPKASSYAGSSNPASRGLSMSSTVADKEWEDEQKESYDDVT